MRRGKGGKEREREKLTVSPGGNHSSSSLFLHSFCVSILFISKSVFSFSHISSFFSCHPLLSTHLLFPRSEHFECSCFVQREGKGEKRERRENKTCQKVLTSKFGSWKESKEGQVWFKWYKQYFSSSSSLSLSLILCSLSQLFFPFPVHLNSCLVPLPLPVTRKKKGNRGRKYNKQEGSNKCINNTDKRIERKKKEHQIASILFLSRIFPPLSLSLEFSPSDSVSPSPRVLRSLYPHHIPRMWSDIYLEPIRFGKQNVEQIERVRRKVSLSLLPLSHFLHFLVLSE